MGRILIYIKKYIFERDIVEKDRYGVVGLCMTVERERPRRMFKGQGIGIDHCPTGWEDGTWVLMGQIVLCVFV